MNCREIRFLTSIEVFILSPPEGRISNECYSNKLIMRNGLRFDPASSFPVLDFWIFLIEDNWLMFCFQENVSCFYDVINFFSSSGLQLCFHNSFYCSCLLSIVDFFITWRMLFVPLHSSVKSYAAWNNFFLIRRLYDNARISRQSINKKINFFLPNTGKFSSQQLSRAEFSKFSVLHKLFDIETWWKKARTKFFVRFQLM